MISRWNASRPTLPAASAACAHSSGSNIAATAALPCTANVRASSRNSPSTTAASSWHSRRHASRAGWAGASASSHARRQASSWRRAYTAIAPSIASTVAAAASASSAARASVGEPSSRHHVPIGVASSQGPGAGATVGSQRAHASPSPTPARRIGPRRRDRAAASSRFNSVVMSSWRRCGSSSRPRRSTATTDRGTPPACGGRPMTALRPTGNTPNNASHAMTQKLN